MRVLKKSQLLVVLLVSHVLPQLSVLFAITDFSSSIINATKLVLTDSIPTQ